MKIPFNEKEMEVVAQMPAFGGGTIPVFNYPISTTELAKRTFCDKEALWILNGSETGFFCPSVIPDHVARGFVFEAVPTPREKFGGKDMFGLNWKYIDVAGGSMSEGKLFDDANDWREYVHFPDIDSWDWEGSAEMNKEYLASGPKILWMLNGCWFERLISFMTFEGAAMALLDDDQLDAIKELIHETTSLYMRIVDKCCQYYDFPGFCIHDDWGSQMAPFFSEAVAREVFLPEMKRFCDHVHSRGKFIDLHSCGKGETRCGVFVDAGFDSWTPMAMNDTDKLWRDYGDKIVISVVCNELEHPESATEEELRAAARAFAAKYARPDRPCVLSSMYSKPGYLTPAFREELYRASRIGCCGQE